MPTLFENGAVKLPDNTPVFGMFGSPIGINLPGLVVTFIVQVSLMTVTMVLALPRGSIMPGYECGAILGRIVGEAFVLVGLLPNHQGAFAVVGACAFTSAYCQAFSMGI